MPVQSDGDKGVGYTFGIEIDGIEIKNITEISGLTMEQDIIELKENGPDGEYVVRKLPGRWKAAEITLTRGLSLDRSFDDWIKQSHVDDKSDVRKSGALVVYDPEGAPVKRYTLVNAWPSKVEISSLKAGDTSVLTEKLVLACERLELE